MPPDQIFGRIEKEIRRKETVLHPKEYYEIYSKYGRVKLYELDFQVFDFKGLSDSLCKKNLQSRQHRRWVFKKENPSEVFTSLTYSGIAEPVAVICKNVRCIERLKPRLLQRQSFVKEAKKTDVRSLLAHFHLTEEQTSFYNKVLT